MTSAFLLDNDEVYSGFFFEISSDILEAALESAKTLNRAGIEIEISLIIPMQYADYRGVFGVEWEMDQYAFTDRKVDPHFAEKTPLCLFDPEGKGQWKIMARKFTVDEDGYFAWETNSIPAREFIADLKNFEKEIEND